MLFKQPEKFMTDEWHPVFWFICKKKKKKKKHTHTQLRIIIMMTSPGKITGKYRVFKMTIVLNNHKMSHDMTKPTKWVCAQRRLKSESLLCIQWVAKDPSFLHVDSEFSDQTGRMPRLIWVFAGRTVTLLILSCCGSKWILYTRQKWADCLRNSFVF